MSPLDLEIDLSDLVAELAAMTELLEAVEEGRDLSELPEAEHPPLRKPPSES